MFGKIQEKKQSENTKFYQEALMVLQNYMPIGLQKIIEKHIIFLHVMEFCLI